MYKNWFVPLDAYICMYIAFIFPRLTRHFSPFSNVQSIKLPLRTLRPRPFSPYFLLITHLKRFGRHCGQFKCIEHHCGPKKHLSLLY